MSTTEHDEMLDRALSLGGRVVVTAGTGKAQKTLTGSLVAQEDGRIKVVTGKAGRPAMLNREDIKAVSDLGVEPRPEGVNEATNTVIESDDPDSDVHSDHAVTPAEAERDGNPDAPSFV